MKSLNNIDSRFRVTAFEFLARLTFCEPDVPVYWPDLVGFMFGGEQCPLIGARGIWKPAILDLPISIRTAPPKPGKPAPYDDQIRDDDTIAYCYQGSDPDARDNVGLRKLLWEKKPLVYLHGIERGVYLAVWPVYVVGDHPESLSVTVDLSPPTTTASHVAEGNTPEYGKQYVFVPSRRRLHQARFRARVMRAYRRRCSICRLGHESLLDAAHIIPDAEVGGVANTQNGLALCKIHHAAFDGNILGIDPDFIVHVREDILEEIDGPMLQHGIKETHGERLRVIPQRRVDQPSRDHLLERFTQFREA